MDSSVSPKDEIWFLRVYHHISTGLYVYNFDLICTVLIIMMMMMMMIIIIIIIIISNDN